MSDWSVIASDLDVKSIPSSLSSPSRGGGVHSHASHDERDGFVDIGAPSPAWLFTDNTPEIDSNDDCELAGASDTFSWISSQNSVSEPDDFVNDERDSVSSPQGTVADGGSTRRKLKPFRRAPVVALVNGKSVLKLQRPKPRSKRDYIRRRKYLCRLATIAETKKKKIQQQMEEEVQRRWLEAPSGSVLRITQARKETESAMTSMSELDESLRRLILDKTKTGNQYLIDLCNHIAIFGQVKTLDGVDINLCESSFVSERLREMIFARLFGEECFTEWNARKNWVDLNKKARMMMLIRFESSEDIHMTFAIHHSVPMDLLLRVVDMRSFELLSQDEWVRVATFGSYCAEARANGNCQEEVERERDVKLLGEIMEQSVFVKLPFLTVESVRRMAGRLKLSVTEEDIQSTFCSTVGGSSI